MRTPLCAFLLGSVLFFSIAGFSCEKEKVEIGEKKDDNTPAQKFTDTLRFASYNVSMFRPQSGGLALELENPVNIQVQKIAAIIQKIRPDVLALMEFDYDADGKSLELFRKNFLEKNQLGDDTIQYRYAYAVSSNTGVNSGQDLNNDGAVRLPDDAIGFGNFPGQYAFALLSRFPLDTANIRTFKNFKWKNMPGALLPRKPDGSSYYSNAALDVLNLSSKNHVDIPVTLPDGSKIHVLLAHPTPPVFDGAEDRNGLRNHDEIRLFADYLSNENYLVDDKGNLGGLPSGEKFVLMGDMNADPYDGDSAQDAILQLLNHPRAHPEITFGAKIPASEGGKEHNRSPGDTGDPSFDTSFFGLRIDYVLPSADVKIINSCVWWPTRSSPDYILIENGGASDHLPVFVDFTLE